MIDSMEEQAKQDFIEELMEIAGVERVEEIDPSELSWISEWLDEVSDDLLVAGVVVSGHSTWGFGPDRGALKVTQQQRAIRAALDMGEKVVRDGEQFLAQMYRNRADSR